jgi:prepilin-type N-terminal cleavage/methylation domain-containing protein
MRPRGFTLVEVIISVVILGVAILGLSAAATSLIGNSTEATAHARALAAVEDRMAQIRMHPVYEQLDSLFSESEVTIDELPGYTRSTSITRIEQDGTGGKVIDYTRITVSVEGPGLDPSISRTVEIGAS